MRNHTADPNAKTKLSAGTPPASRSCANADAGSAAAGPSVHPEAGRFYSCAEVAEIFGKSPRTIRLWVKSGRLKALKLGGIRLIPDTEILRVTGYKIALDDSAVEPALDDGER